MPIEWFDEDAYFGEEPELNKQPLPMADQPMEEF